MSYKRKNLSQVLFLILITSLFAACGGGTQDEAASSENSSSSSDNFDANLNLAFNVDMILDAQDGDTDLEITLNDDYTLPMLLDSDGSLTVRAKDMPAMIYRVCATGSTRAGCDTYTDLTAGLDADLVIDSCGRLVDNEDCGDADDTTFDGSIAADGSMIINDLSMRVRAFLVTSTSSGSSADDGDSGLLTFHRMLMDLSTGTVSTTDFTRSGDVISSSSVTLVASGTVSTSSADLDSADFIATLAGTFDEDPLLLLE